MAISVTRGGAFRGLERKDVHTPVFRCPLCGAYNTKRKSLLVRGARFCKKHGSESIILSVMEWKKKERSRLTLSD